MIIENVEAIARRALDKLIRYRIHVDCDENSIDIDVRGFKNGEFVIVMQKFSRLLLDRKLTEQEVAFFVQDFIMAYETRIPMKFSRKTKRAHRRPNLH